MRLCPWDCVPGFGGYLYVCLCTCECVSVCMETNRPSAQKSQHPTMRELSLGFPPAWVQASLCTPLAEEAWFGEFQGLWVRCVGAGSQTKGSTRGPELGPREIVQVLMCSAPFSTPLPCPAPNPPPHHTPPPPRRLNPSPHYNAPFYFFVSNSSHLESSRPFTHSSYNCEAKPLRRL